MYSTGFVVDFFPGGGPTDTLKGSKELRTMRMEGVQPIVEWSRWMDAAGSVGWQCLEGEGDEKVKYILLNFHHGKSLTMTSLGWRRTKIQR